MDNKVALQVALANINSTIEVLRDNTEFNLIHSNLNTVKIVLESQIEEPAKATNEYGQEHSDAYYDYTRNDADAKNPFVHPQDVLKADEVVGKTNTYRVEEETTSGWTLADKNAQGLSRDAAKTIIDSLINDGAAPYRIRVVVDGQST
tara:strand:- start:735 stop:1178 length:444 start_codon:yes stop_codon:yes gene_type:complete